MVIFCRKLWVVSKLSSSYMQQLRYDKCEEKCFDTYLPLQANPHFQGSLLFTIDEGQVFSFRGTQLRGGLSKEGEKYLRQLVTNKAYYMRKMSLRTVQATTIKIKYIHNGTLYMALARVTNITSMKDLMQVRCSRVSTMKMMEPYLFQWTTFTTVDKGVAFTNLELKYLHIWCASFK